MPTIFNFKCEDCDEEFTQLVHTSTMIVRCPACDSIKVVKQLTSFKIAQTEPWRVAGQRLK